MSRRPRSAPTPSPAPAAVPRRPLLARLGEYQAERFPLVGYVPLVAAFTSAAAAYSRASRGLSGLVPWPLLLTGILTTLVFFFLLRVLDEHKDAEVDRTYRPELPVPRGLILLAELRTVGAGLLVPLLLLNALLAPVLLLPCLAVAAWAALMTREFFVPEWLRSRPALYLVSHMAIMPLIDAYTTGLDWIVAGGTPSRGLNWFLIVTFLNGTLLEIGRKVRAPEREREGVDTYTRVWGIRPTLGVWIAVLLCSAAGVRAAAGYTGTQTLTTGALAVFTPLVLSAGIRFLRTPTPEASERVELMSGLWTLASYLLLGFGPLASRALGL